MVVFMITNGEEVGEPWLMMASHGGGWLVGEGWLGCWLIMISDC